MPLFRIERHLQRSHSSARKSVVSYQKTSVAPPRGATYTLPIDHTQLLGLRGRDSYLDPQILAAYEALAAAPIEQGFSARAAEGRTVLLQAAVDELRRSKGRGTMQEKEVDVEWTLLPGALALLQEVGEFDIVLEHGNRALEKWEARSMRRDILFAMSLAHLGLASEALEAKDKKVALGCAHLEEALCLLKDAGQPPISPILEQEIQEALIEFKPDCTLEHLKLPLGAENANTRKAAIAVLQAMLAQPELAARRDGSPAVTPEFVRAALAALTGPELVQLLDWADIAPSAPQLSWAYPGMGQKAALAHMVVGFAQRRPHLVRVAENLLNLVPESTVLVERVIAKALLDAPEEAVQLLLDAERRGDLQYGRQPDVSSSAADSSNGAGLNGAAPLLGHIRQPDGKEALAFIRAHSPDGDQDLLPGLSQFTERWLVQVAFPQLRDTLEKAPSSSLHAYYEDKRVTSFLALRGDEGRGMLGRVASIGDGMASSLSRLLPSPRGAQKPAAGRQDAAAAAGSAAPKEKRLPELVSATSQRRRRWLPAWLPAPGKGAATFVGAAVLLGAVAAAAKLRPMPKPLDISALGPEAAIATGTVVQRMKFPWKQISNQDLTISKAEQIVRRWQAAKAEALGPRHSIAALHSTVAEPWMTSVKTDAAKAKEAGWFWQFKINSVKVLKVDNSNLTENGGHAVVAAWIDERGDLYANSGKRSESHSYSNPYTVEYTVVRGPDGGWRINNALVTGGR